MALSQQDITRLGSYFLSKDGGALQGDVHPGTTDIYDLGRSDKKWDVIYAVTVIADNIQSGGGVGDADTVDGFHAAQNPLAGLLLALDESSVFPTGVYNQALLKDGSRALEGSLTVVADATIDGVDIGVHVHTGVGSSGDQIIHADLLGNDADDHLQYAERAQDEIITGDWMFTHLVDRSAGWQFLPDDKVFKAIPHNLILKADENEASIGLGVYSSSEYAIFLYDDDTPETYIKVGRGADSITLSGTDATYRIWAGHADGASAPFSVEKDGSIYAIDGEIAGWTIDSSAISKNDMILHSTGYIAAGTGDNLVRIDSQDATWRLWAGNAVAANAPFRVNKTGDLYIGSGYVSGVLRSTNFISGQSGFGLNSSGLAEFDNIIARGRLQATVFAEATISVASGKLIISDGAVIAVDMADTDDFIIVDAPVFLQSDIIRLKPDAFRDEWMRITSPYTVEGDGYKYYLIRELNSGEGAYAGPYDFYAGESVVRMGSAEQINVVHPLTSGEEGGEYGEYQPGGSGSTTGGGFLILEGSRQFGPYFGVAARYGPVYDQLLDVVRIGNLEGILDYVSEEWGAFFGDANAFMAYDQTQGLRIDFSGSGADTTIDDTGIATETISIAKVTAPGSSVDPYGYLYHDTSDNLLYWKYGAVSYNLTAGGGGAAPSTAEYLVMSLSGGLSAERRLQGTANQITLTDGGAEGDAVLSLPQDIHIGATPTFENLILSSTDIVKITAFNTTSGGNAELQIGQSQASDHTLVIGFDDTNTYGFIQVYGDSQGDALVIADGGLIGIGRAPVAALDVYRTQTETSGTIMGARVDLGSTPSGASTANSTGVQLLSRFYGTNNQTQITGAYGSAIDYATAGTLINLVGVDALVTYLSASGTHTVTKAVALKARMYTSGTAYGTIDSLRFIETGTGAAAGSNLTVTNAYGLYILPIGIGTTKWGIYQEGTDDNYLGGRVQLGNDLLFQQASEITTTSGDLTIDPAGDIVVSGTGGIDYVRSGDGDLDIVTLSVDGTPRSWWDESENRFAWTHGLRVTGDITMVGGNSSLLSTGNLYLDATGDGALNLRVAGFTPSVIVGADSSITFKTSSIERMLIIAAGEIQFKDDLAFQQASTISTTAGDLTLDPTGDLIVDADLVVQSSTSISGDNPHLRIKALFGALYGTKIALDATALTGGDSWEIFSSADAAGEGGGKLVFYNRTSSKYGLMMASDSSISMYGDLAFQQASTISTTAGDLTLDPAGGDVIIDGGFSSILRLTGAAAGDGIIHFGDDIDDDIGRIEYSFNIDRMAFYTNANIRMVILNDGNVGIGTPTPGANVEIYESANNLVEQLRLHNPSDGAAAGSFIGFIQGSGSTDAGKIISGFDGSNFYMALETSGTEVIRLVGGDVGIRIATPDGTLHVHTATAGAVTAGVADDLVVENSAEGGISLLFPDVINAWYMFGSPTDNDHAGIGANYSAGELYFRVAGGTRLQMSASAMAFNQAQTISTTAGDLTLNPAGILNVTKRQLITLDHEALELQAVTGTQRIYQQIGNATGNVFLGMESSAGGSTFTGSTAYAGFIGTSTQHPFEIAAGNTIRLSITTAGNLALQQASTISTTSGDLTLDPADAVILDKRSQIKGIAAPGAGPAGYGNLYAKTDGKLYFHYAGGGEVDLTQGGGTGLWTATNGNIYPTGNKGIEFQTETTISTASGNLALSPAGVVAVITSVSAAATHFGLSSTVTRTAGASGDTVALFGHIHAQSGVTAPLWGIATEAWAYPGANVILIGSEFAIVNEEDNNTQAKVGVDIVFKDRADGQTATQTGLGSNKYNEYGRAIQISAQARSTDGEYSGWQTAFFFPANALDRTVLKDYTVIMDLRAVTVDQASTNPWLAMWDDGGTEYGLKFNSTSNTIEWVADITGSPTTYDLTAGGGGSPFSGGIIVNESGGDNDSRFEGENEDVFLLDASADSIILGPKTTNVMPDATTNRLMLFSDGTAPKYPLGTVAEGLANIFQQLSVGSSDNLGAGFLARYARGTFASPTQTQSGDRLGFFLFGGVDNVSGWGNQAGFIAYTTQDYTSVNRGTKLELLATADGSASRAVVATLQEGIQVGVPTGGDKGTGTINVAEEVYRNEESLSSVLEGQVFS